MEVERLKREVRKMQERTAKLTTSDFSYYEQELIRRVLKSVLPQIKSATDVSTAKEILKKTEWLDNG